MTSGLRWLLPWPQIVQVNPAKFYPPAAELQSDNASRCSSTGLHTFWHVLLRLWWRILFVCHHSGTYCHLLLQGPRSPPLLPLLSLSVALRSPCAFFLFFVSGISPPPSSSTCLHCIFLLVVIFVFLLLSATMAPSLAEFNPQTRFCSFLLCRASTQSQPPPFSFRCHTLPVFSSSSFFRLSSPCHVCLSASALMDLSVGGLQHVLALASVTRDDLHLIRGSRWACETCWGM